MKILHVIGSLGVGGAEAMLLKLIIGGDSNAIQQKIVTIQDSKSQFLERAAEFGIGVESLGVRSGSVNPLPLFKIIPIIRRERPDIVHTWLHHADLIGTFGAVLARSPAIIWNIRCSYLDRKDHSRSLFWIIRLLAAMSNIPRAIIVNSGAGRLAHEKYGYIAKRWELIPNGFDTDVFKPSEASRIALRQSLGMSIDTILIGMIARYHPMKDHETFLKAAWLLHQRRSDVRFVLVGLGIDKNNRNLTEILKSTGTENIVSLLGEKRNIHEISAAMDISTLTSYSEGFPNAIGEAMACGVPCVATGVGDVLEIIGETGQVIPERDPEALAGAWEKILSMEPQARKALGMAARIRIIERYSLESVVRRYQDLYMEIMERSGRRNGLVLQK